MKGFCYLVFSFSLLFAASFCNADGDMFAGECVDCDNFKTSKFFSEPFFKHPKTESPWKKKFPPIKDFLHPFPKPEVPIDVPNVPSYKPKPKLKPVTPHVPIYKPKPKPKPVVYEQAPKQFPVGFDKGLPIPPFFKKKAWPKIPKKNFFQHPKFGYFAPLPPFGIPHYP